MNSFPHIFSAFFPLICWIYQLFSCPEKRKVHHHPRLATLALHTNVPDHYMNYTWSVITTTTTTSLMLINIPAGKVFSSSLVWILDGTHHSYSPCPWPAKPPIDQAHSLLFTARTRQRLSFREKKTAPILGSYRFYVCRIECHWSWKEIQQKYEPMHQQRGKYVPLNVM